MDTIIGGAQSPDAKGKRYTFVTNSRGRRILIVNKAIQIENIDDLDSDYFDAIYINIVHHNYEENRVLLRWLSPTRVDKCFLKPRFATAALEEVMHFAAYLIDGFCDSPVDERFTDFIEQIYSNIEKYNISRELTNDLSTTSRILANMVRYDISRGRLLFTMHSIRGLAEGYSAMYLARYDNQETLQYDERMKFGLKLEELGFAERSRFIDRVHVCHSCGCSHLLFIECCPKCGSSNIRQESMIHHFRCANISPETTYAYDGQLCCPKCRRILRHIGVDYDRPATVFTCNNITYDRNNKALNCGNTFLAPAMKVRCAQCGSESTPDELAPIDVWEYKLTPKGIEAFAGDDGIFQIESNDIYSGRSTFDNFIESIRMFNNLHSYEDNALFVYRYHYHYDGDQENWQLFDIMRTLLSRITTIKIATQNSNIYILVVVHKERMEAEHDRIKKMLDHIFHDYVDDSEDVSMVRWIKTYRMQHDDDSDVFINQLNEYIEEEHNDREPVEEKNVEPDRQP